MRIKLTQRTRWKGKLLIVPAFAGRFRAAHPAARVLEGLAVADEAGDTSFVRGDKQDALLVSLGKRDLATADVVRRAGGSAAGWLERREVRTAGIDADAIEAGRMEGGLTALCEGLLLGAFRFVEYKSAPAKRSATTVDVLVDKPTAALGKEIDRAGRVAEATNLAREIAHQPPNVVYPVSLATRARKLASRTGLTCKVLDERQLERLKMGAMLAVGRGSDTPPRLIVLEYKGQAGGKPVVLVGKAITFDTGGYSIKTKDAIVGMKYDKCGGTAVLGAMQAAAALKLKTPVVGIVAAAENMVSAAAYRPDDIVTTMSGQTVEIVSADAEGRMVLCDALTYAQRHYQPRAIIDLATLTGGVVVALGNHRAGLFCNDERLQAALMASGDRTHELLWPMPLDDEYLEPIKGADGDLKNSAGREAHAVTGAMFLKQFIEPKTPWAHLDIAGVAHTDKDQPYCPKGATGFGVRLLADFLERAGRN